VSNTDQLTPLEVASDLGKLGVLPLLLAAIYFFVPISIQEQLALDHQNVQLYALFTAAYVHAGTGHLIANITGYAVAVSYAYWLCLQTERRKWFWSTTVVLLVAVPIVVNASNLVLFGTYLPEVTGLSRGFSGVVGAFGGFLFVAFVVAVRDTYDGNLAQLAGMSLFLLLLVMLEVVYAGTVRPVVGVAVLFGIAVQIIGYFYERERSFDVTEIVNRELLIQFVGGLLIVTVLGYLVFALFPSRLIQGDGFVNIFAHSLGFFLGVSLSSYIIKQAI
jgi:hypothetical protein